jgi:hypothetical protein
MDDVVYMTIINTRENLLDKQGSITLIELTTFNDLIEKFTTFADFLNQIVTFVVFKELKHFDDIWMVKLFQDINFVEKHALLIFVHVIFTKNFNSALGVSGSVDTHSNLAKCSITKYLTNTVMVSQFTFVLLYDVLSADSNFLFSFNHYAVEV